MFDLGLIKMVNKMAVYVAAYSGTYPATLRADYGTWNTKTFPQSGPLPKRSK